MAELGVVIVTRLAVRRRTGPPPTEAWLADRLALFRDVVVPATVAGIGPGAGPAEGIAWVLLVDPNSRDRCVDALADLDPGPVTLVPAAAVGMSPTTAEIEPEAPVLPGVDEVLTVRLDSDDVLLPGALSAARAAATDAPDGTLVDLPRGVQIDLDDGRVVAAHYPPWRQGPFLGIVHRDRRSMLDTGGPHASARAGRPVRTVPDRAWVQLVHGGNASNSLEVRSAPARWWSALRGAPSGGWSAGLERGRPLPDHEADAIRRAVLPDA